MANLTLESGLAAMAFARQVTLSFVEDIPEDQLCHQPIADANHALWVLGHLALSDDSFLTKLAGRPTGCPAGWQDRFGMGSKPLADPAEYPSLEELKTCLSERRETLVAWFRSLSEEQLASPLPEDWQTFAPNHAAMISTIAWHEGLHAGQLTVMRKSLAIPPKYG